MFIVKVAKEARNNVKEKLREEVSNVINKRLRHVRIRINELWLMNKIRIIVEGTIIKIIARYTEKLGILYNIKRGPLLGAPFKRAKLDGGEVAKEVAKAAELDTRALDKIRVNIARKHLYAAQKSV